MEFEAKYFSVARLLTFVTGLINQELLLKNEYLLAENRILKAYLPPGFRLGRSERTALAEIAKRLGRKLLQQVASVANPDTILGWYRQLVAAKFDGSASAVARPAAGSLRRSSVWWFGWRERIPAGAMTGSWER